MRKLLLAGSNTIHTYNFYQLVSDYFDDILVVTDRQTNLFEGIPHEYVDFSFRKPWNIRPVVNRIRKITESYSPNIIHVQQAGTESWMLLKASAKLKIPKIVTAWGSDILYTPNKGILYRTMLKYILKNADAFTCDSYIVASRMQEFASPSGLDIVIANFGINIDIKEVPKENIIYSNRLHKDLYRLDKLIIAFKAFISDRKMEGWRLIIAGSGEETDNLKKLVSRLGLNQDVDFVGWVDKNTNSELYGRAKIFASIPSSDATAISLLEAMSAGCIPVLSNLPANHEWVIDGLNGIIVNDLSGNFLLPALELDAGKASVINKEIIKNKGSKDSNREKFITLYQRLLGDDS